MGVIVLGHSEDEFDGPPGGGGDDGEVDGFGVRRVSSFDVQLDDAFTVGGFDAAQEESGDDGVALPDGGVAADANAVVPFVGREGEGGETECSGEVLAIDINDFGAAGGGGTGVAEDGQRVARKDGRLGRSKERQEGERQEAHRVTDLIASILPLAMRGTHPRRDNGIIAGEVKRHLQNIRDAVLGAYSHGGAGVRQRSILLGAAELLSGADDHDRDSGAGECRFGFAEDHRRYLQGGSAGSGGPDPVPDDAAGFAAGGVADIGGACWRCGRLRA